MELQEIVVTPTGALIHESKAKVPAVVENAYPGRDRANQCHRYGRISSIHAWFLSKETPIRDPLTVLLSTGETTRP